MSFSFLTMILKLGLSVNSLIMLKQLLLIYLMMYILYQSAFYHHFITLRCVIFKTLTHANTPMCHPFIIFTVFSLKRCELGLVGTAAEKEEAILYRCYRVRYVDGEHVNTGGFSPNTGCSNTIDY